MIQQVDESIDSFLSRLRAQAAKCKFVYTVGEVIKDVSDELIRDRIVVGVQDETTRSRLLREPKLTLTSAVEMIRAVEVADEYVQRIKDSKAVDRITASQNKRKFKQKFKQHSTKPQINDKSDKNSGDCRKCGKQHAKNDCPAYGKTCFKCKKLNHYSSMCLNNKAVNMVQADNKDRYMRETCSGSNNVYNAGNSIYSDGDTDLFLGLIGRPNKQFQ